MVEMHKLIFFIGLVFISLDSFAQDKANLKVDERINEELRMKNAKVDSTNISGYRIQIFFRSDLKEAQATAAAFKVRFPEFADQVYLEYQQPYWKVRIGDFYREIDAQKLLEAVREFYPDAFVVKDGINLPPIVIQER